MSFEEAERLTSGKKKCVIVAGDININTLSEKSRIYEFLLIICVYWQNLILNSGIFAQTMSMFHLAMT